MPGPARQTKREGSPTGGPFSLLGRRRIGMDRAMSAAAALRALTQPLHDRVDAAFGDMSLADGASYRRFLRAHALALPAAEAALASVGGLPLWRPRTPLLAADLGELGEAVPPTLPLALPTGDAAGWGVFYVVEGSRLGGAMLARRVASGLPRRYLAAAHLSGEWRAQRAAIDVAAEVGGADWIERAVAGAEACFALYACAAEAALAT